jgi:hypothetical protein
MRYDRKYDGGRKISVYGSKISGMPWRTEGEALPYKDAIWDYGSIIEQFKI